VIFNLSINKKKKHFLLEYVDIILCDIFYREMIFEHLVITFVTTFSFILTLFFTLSLYCFGYRTNTYFFFVNYGCHISCQTN